MKVYIYNVFDNFRMDYLEEITINLNSKNTIEDAIKKDLVARYPHLLLDETINNFNTYSQSNRENFSSSGWNVYHIRCDERIWNKFYCEHTDTDNMLWQLFDAVIQDFHDYRAGHNEFSNFSEISLYVLSAFLFTFRNDYKKQSNKMFAEYLLLFDTPNRARHNFHFFCKMENTYNMLINECPEIFYHKPLTKEDYDAIAIIKSFHDKQGKVQLPDGKGKKEMNIYFYNSFSGTKIEFWGEITVKLNSKYSIDKVTNRDLVTRYPHLRLEETIDIFNSYCHSIRKEFSTSGWNVYQIGSKESILETYYCEHMDIDNMLWQLFNTIIEEIHGCREEHNYEADLYDTALLVLSAFLHTYKNEFKEQSNKEFAEYLLQFASLHNEEDYSFFYEIEDIYYMLRNECPEIFYHKPLTKEDYDAVAIIKSFYANKNRDN